MMNSYNLRWFRVLLALLFLSVGVGAQSWDSDQHSSEMRRKAERRYLPKHPKMPVFRYYDYTVIERSQIIDGHVVVVGHHLRVEGLVRGSILVLDADVTIGSGGLVEGGVTSVAGQIYLSDGGNVRGNMLETHRDFISRQRDQISKVYRYSWRPYRDRSPWYRMDDPDEENLLLRYNRIDGGFVGLQIPQEYHKNVYLSPYGFVGYGFESRKVRYQIGLDRPVLHQHNNATIIGAELHSLTDTQDEWRLDQMENSLAAFFAKQDYYDYFEREGYSISLTQLLIPSVRATVSYRNDDYKTLAAQTNWALFNGDANFRRNPFLGEDAGNMRSIYTALRIDTRNRQNYPTRGMFAEINGEFSNPGLGGDFDFERYLLNVSLYQPLTYGENFQIRAIAGTSTGELPFQKRFELGGIGSLRGFSYKEFTGNRMFLANIEYHIMPDLMDDWFDLDGLAFILFSDVGNAWNGSGDQNIIQSFRPLRWDNLKSSLGFGIGDDDGTFRIDFAKRTDRSANMVVTLRLQQPF